MGTEKVEHARCTFAVVEDSRRVHPERPCWPIVPPPASACRLPPLPPPTKGRGRAPAPPPHPPPPPQARLHRGRPDAIVVRAALATSSKRSGRDEEVEPDDVIDLGAPRELREALLEAPRVARARKTLTPNPRLYPGPQQRRKRNVLPKVVENRQANQRPEHRRPENRRAENRRTENRGSGEKRGRRRKHAFRRAVPNPRLYRPPPARAPPPPAAPYAQWSPPAPSARLDTASRVAFHLSEQRRAQRHGLAREPVTPPQSPQLVVTLPSSAPASPRYRPTSTHFRLRSLNTDSSGTTPVAGRSRLRVATAAMDPGKRHSTSPEDCSDGNETPSEFLAEFLSAIMRRQYAEALKYCRLILQYEPHNATARGFYPLLQHKVQAHKRPDEDWPRGSSSEEASAPASEPLIPRRALPHTAQHKQEVMEQGGDSSEGSEEEGGASRPSSPSGGSCCSQSSLEMDSSEALAHSSPSLSRRTEHTDSASGGGCDSVGSASRSDADDNGNATSAPRPASDLANDNAALSAEPLKSDSLASLRRLRAQFTCSIK